METRKHNFNAGPAVLPLEVLEVAKEHLLNYNKSGLGILEISHRSSHFESIIKACEANLRELLGLSDDYAVIFATGGATNQFSMVPMNLLKQGETADYIISGSWAEKAWEEAQKFGAARQAGSTKEQNFGCIPRDLSLSDNPAYVHFTSNNTIYGTQFRTEPAVGSRVLVCDASSDLLYKQIDVSKYGLIYAGAQKNLGPAGVTLVIVRKDLLERSPKSLPVMMNYNTYVKSDSLYNTPPVFAIFVVGLVLEWLKRQGGLAEIERRNELKAAELYEYIDSTDFYSPVVKTREDRSLMNVCFRLSDQDLEADFIKAAQAAGLVGLKGHRSVGGLRASLYNALPRESVTALVSFMKDFAAKH